MSRIVLPTINENCGGVGISLAQLWARFEGVKHTPDGRPLKTVLKNSTTLKEEAVRLGYVSPGDVDAWVKPEDMVGSLK